MDLSQFDHLAPPGDKQFVSMGYVMQLLQIMPAQLKTLMESAKVRFSQTVDGIGYLSVADAELVAAKCIDVRKEIHDTVQAAKHN